MLKHLLNASSLFCFSVLCVDRSSVVWEIPHKKGSWKDFILRIENNRPNIKLRWTTAEAEQGHLTIRVMWEDSKWDLLFACVENKYFLCWHIVNFSQPSVRAFSRGESLLWTPAPLASAGSPSSVQGTVWASHWSGFCPHRTHRLPRTKNNEIFLSHSFVLWLY